MELLDSQGIMKNIRSNHQGPHIYCAYLLDLYTITVKTKYFLCPIYTIYKIGALRLGCVNSESLHLEGTS